MLPSFVAQPLPIRIKIGTTVFHSCNSALHLRLETTCRNELRSSTTCLVRVLFGLQIPTGTRLLVHNFGYSFFPFDSSTLYFCELLKHPPLIYPWRSWTRIYLGQPCLTPLVVSKELDNSPFISGKACVPLASVPLAFGLSFQLCGLWFTKHGLEYYTWWARCLHRLISNLAQIMQSCITVLLKDPLVGSAIYGYLPRFP